MFGLCPLTWFFVSPPLCPIGICGLVAEFWSLLIEDRYFGIPSFWLIFLIGRYLNLFFGVHTLFSLYVHSFLSRIGICGLKAELEFSSHWGERFGDSSFWSPFWWGLSFYFVCCTFPSCRCIALRSTPCLVLKKKVLKKQAFYVETCSFGNKKRLTWRLDKVFIWFTVVQLCMQTCESLGLRRRKAIESVTPSIQHLFSFFFELSPEPTEILWVW